jgi:Zn-dependent protease
MSNLFLAVVAGVMLKGLYSLKELPATAFVPIDVWLFAGMMLLYLITANICLCFFNLIPLFPLDGHHIARELLPPWKQQGFMQWQLTYGQKLLMGLIFGPWLLRMAMPQVYTVPVLKDVLDPIATVAGFVTHAAMRVLMAGG